VSAPPGNVATAPGAESRRLMCIAFHPYVMGRPPG